MLPTASRGPTIPPAPGADNRRTLPTRAPTRAEIPRATTGFLQRGEPDKADLLLVDLGDGEMVVKDFAAKAWWVRVLGRVQIAREARAYRFMGPMPGLPALIGRVDGLALALERVPGERIAFMEDPRARGAEHLAKLRVLIDGMHAAGVVHNDLRGRENLLVREDGEVVVLDLAGAIRLRPGGLPYRLLFRFLSLADEAAYLEWKEFLTPGAYTPEEEAFLRRFGRLRALWPFNRKGRRRGGEP